MDLKQVEYILKIAEENNITRAAEKLFLTQSALNQQLLKLEKELGTPLFYRSRTNWRPTPAGEAYISGARELLRVKKMTYDRIRDIANTQKGTLRIGITSGRGIHLFASVYPIFHRKYPEIKVEPIENNVRILQNMITDGEVDIGFLTLTPKDHTTDEYILLQEEEIVLALPTCHPLAAGYKKNAVGYPVLPLSAVAYEPFVIMDKASTMRRPVNHIFEEAGIVPNILFETKNHTTVVSMIQSNLCCGLLPDFYARRVPLEVTVFALPTHPTWEVVASYRKGGYLSDAARDFIDMARRYWNS